MRTSEGWKKRLTRGREEEESVPKGDGLREGVARKSDERKSCASARGSYRYYRSRKVWRVKISRIYEETCRILLVAAVIVEDVSPPGEFYLPAGWTTTVRCLLAAVAAAISPLGLRGFLHVQLASAHVYV